MGVHIYSSWNRRQTDGEPQIEPLRKYFFICEGANTETVYFRKLIDLRKELGIHPLIDLALLEKTGEDRNLSYAKNLVSFAFKQKEKEPFDRERDKMVIVFDADIFEEKAQGYEELIQTIEKNDLAAVSNPSFELFLLLHLENSYERCIEGHEQEFFAKGEHGGYRHAYETLRALTGMNSKKNPQIGELASDVKNAIAQEKRINEDIHHCRGRLTCNVAAVIESIINERPEI